MVMNVQIWHDLERVDVCSCCTHRYRHRNDHGIFHLQPSCRTTLSLPVDWKMPKPHVTENGKIQTEEGRTVRGTTPTVKSDSSEVPTMKKKPSMKRKGDSGNAEENKPASKRQKLDAAEGTGRKKKTTPKQKSSRPKARSAKTGKILQSCRKLPAKDVDILKSEECSAESASDVNKDGLFDLSTVAASSKSTSNHGKFVGAHVSITGGLWKAVEEAVKIGARSFGMFLKSQRQWKSKPLPIKDAEKFKNACKEHSFSPFHIVPHGSYLLNCGSPKEDVLKKSRDMLIDELKRCESLGLALFNFHPGSTCGVISVDECIEKIAESINMAHDETKYVIAVIENMSCQGNTIGGKFEELRAIIDQVKDKSRIGVCLDTCHAFAAGYDIATKEGYEKMMSQFNCVVGLKYLKALHINDSKGEVGCHLDRHENIGMGKIGLEGFRRVMNDPRLNGLPMVLETPYGDYATEIRQLNSLIRKG